MKRQRQKILAMHTPKKKNLTNFYKPISLKKAMPLNR